MTPVVQKTNDLLQEIKEIKEIAEGMTRQELVAAWIRSAIACEEAEVALEEALSDVEDLDKAISKHPAAVADYEAQLFDSNEQEPAAG